MAYQDYIKGECSYCHQLYTHVGIAVETGELRHMCDDCNFPEDLPCNITFIVGVPYECEFTWEHE